MDVSNFPDLRYSSSSSSNFKHEKSRPKVNSLNTSQTSTGLREVSLESTSDCSTNTKDTSMMYEPHVSSSVSKTTDTWQPESKQINEHLDGYKVYTRLNKIFTFTVYKEDYLNIPDQYSKVITHVTSKQAIPFHSMTHSLLPPFSVLRRWRE